VEYIGKQGGLFEIYYLPKTTEIESNMYNYTHTDNNHVSKAVVLMDVEVTASS